MYIIGAGAIAVHTDECGEHAHPHATKGARIASDTPTARSRTGVFTCLSIYLCIYVSMYVCMYLSIYLSICIYKSYII